MNVCPKVANRGINLAVLSLLMRPIPYNQNHANASISQLNRVPTLNSKRILASGLGGPKKSIRGDSFKISPPVQYTLNTYNVMGVPLRASQNRGFLSAAILAQANNSHIIHVLV